VKLFTYTLLSIFLSFSIAANADQTTTSIKIEKMDCPSCPFMIKRAIEKLNGVVSASVSMETKTAVVIFEDEKVATSDFIATTTELGFPSHEIRE